MIRKAIKTDMLLWFLVIFTIVSQDIMFRQTWKLIEIWNTYIFLIMQIGRIQYHTKVDVISKIKLNFQTVVFLEPVYSCNLTYSTLEQVFTCNSQYTSY